LGIRHSEIDANFEFRYSNLSRWADFMSENENIEAKLCSYVEGDLDAQGRAEIDQYLLAHPQYRPLIAELARSRGLLRDLPRESAPAELLETLSGQIERSALLGDDDAGAMRMQPNRIPHLAAWAAVLLLTAGLAAVIYRVLPANKSQPEVALLKAAPQPTTLAYNATDESAKTPLDSNQMPAAQMLAAQSPVPQTPTTLAATATLADAAVKAPVIQNGDAQAISPMPSASPPPPTTTSSDVASAEGSSDRTVLSGGTGGANANAQQQGMGGLIGSQVRQDGQDKVVTLHATDAKAADARITQYLNDNRIAFESHPIDARISSGPIAPPIVSAAPSSINALGGTLPLGPMNAPTAESGAPPASSQEVATLNPPAAMRFMRKAQIGGALSTTAPEERPPQMDSGKVIVARMLTPDQARRLTSDLNLLVSAAPADAVATSTPSLRLNSPPLQVPLGAESTLQTGQSIQIVAREKLLPDVDAMNETQAIDSDGNITLPMVGKVKAAGLSNAELEQEIAQAYRDAKSPTDAYWTIGPVPANPSTTPTTQSALTLTPQHQADLPAGATATTAPIAIVLDKDLKKDQQGIPSGTRSAGEHEPVDVTIRIIQEPVSSTGPAIQEGNPTAKPNATTAGPATRTIGPPAAPAVAFPPVSTPNTSTMPTTMQVP
jgi:hypothetical protein